MASIHGCVSFGGIDVKTRRWRIYGMGCKPGGALGASAEEEAGGIIIFESWIRQACTVGDEPLTLVGWSACCILHLTLGLGLSSRGCAHPCGSRGAYGPPSPPVPFPARRPPRCTGRSILGANSGGHRSLLRRGTLARPRRAPPRSPGHFLRRRELAGTGPPSKN